MVHNNGSQSLRGLIAVLLVIHMFVREKGRVMYLDEKLRSDQAYAQSNERVLKATIEGIVRTSEEHRAFAKKRQDSLVKPPSSLGKLEDISIKLAGIYREQFYATEPKAILAFAGDHGIYEEGISGQPQEVTQLAFTNFPKGLCSVGVLSKYMGSAIVAVDVGINSDEQVNGIINRKIKKGTNNLSKEAAMTRDEAIQSMVIGIEFANKYIDQGYRIIGLGEMGICNTSPSSAIVAVLTGANVEDVTGIGAGSALDKVNLKIELIKRGIAINKPDKTDAIDVLAKVGGLEIGAITGVILACANRQIPVVLDGFISYAAAMLAKVMNPISVEYMLASHKSAEPASMLALSELGLDPSLDMNMRLGEGSGTALFFNVIECANQVYTNVASFEGAKVPETGLEKKLD